MDNLVKCEDCRYFIRINYSELGKGNRYPPTVVLRTGGGESIFPVIKYEDWCGEFKYR